MPISPREARKLFSPSLFSYQDGLSWHLHIGGQSVPSAVTVLRPAVKTNSAPRCTGTYLMLGHTSNGRARAPVCPSLATPVLSTTAKSLSQSEKLLSQGIKEKQEVEEKLKDETAKNSATDAKRDQQLKQVN